MPVVLNAGSPNTFQTFTTAVLTDIGRVYASAPLGQNDRTDAVLRIPMSVIPNLSPAVLFRASRPHSKVSR